MLSLNNIGAVDQHQRRQLICKGCENHCSITRFEFDNGNVFFGGNKCEKIFSSKGSSSNKGYNLMNYKNELLFGKASTERSETGKLSIGITRSLNMYENFPFWHTLLEECGVHVVLSSHSTTKLYEKGLGTVMSDNICFPAKLVHGHVYDLAEKKVDRIFMPMVFHEKKQVPSQHTYNCPIVTGYAEVIQSAVNPEKKWGIPVDAPTISFRSEELLKQGCRAYIDSLAAAGLEVSASQFNAAFAAALEAQNQLKQKLQAKAEELIAISSQNDTVQLVVLAGRPYHSDNLINQKTAEILTELGANVITVDVLPAIIEGQPDFYLAQWGYPALITNAAKWVAVQPNNVRMVMLNSFGCGPDSIITDEVKEILQAVGKNSNLIRVDEITSTGSIRLRLRSIVEFAKYSKPETMKKSEKKRKTNKLFMPEDKDRVILAPLFSDIYSQVFPAFFELFGFKLVTLPVTSSLSLEEGLKYTNNEICYPAITVIGDVIHALKSGKYDLNKVAVGITQTGGQCRASNYLSLIKKALVNAGYEDIPVISVATATGLHEQPGFSVPWGKIMTRFLSGIIFADELSKMHYATVFREINAGESRTLTDLYLAKLHQTIVNGGKVKHIYHLLAEAVEAFNRIPVKEGDFPKVGIVGEIYLKYNNFANLNVVDFLNKQEVEVIVPSLLDFFIQDLVNNKVNQKANIDKRTLKGRVASFFIRKFLNSYMNRAEKVMKGFRFYRASHSIEEVAQGASTIVNLAHQYGEGWLIPGEIVSFMKQGVYNVVSLQPFGCIANQVISKGVEKKMKDMYPNLNLLFLDFDAGASEVNVFNRLYFIVKAAKEGLEKQKRMETAV